MRLSLTVTAFTLLTPLAALAQDPDAPPPPPAEVPMAPAAEPAPAPMTMSSTSAPAINFEALVDTYYMRNFTGKPSVQGPGLRQFDTVANSFTLNYAEVAAYMSADPVGFRIDLGVGNTANIVNGASAAAGLGVVLVQQAYATAKLGPDGMVTLDAGRFVTSASDEVIESKSNWNYSRSLLFFGVPLFHTGIRATVAVNEMVSIQGSVVNGWNNDPDVSHHKTFGGQVALTLPSKTNVFATTYIGKEAAGAKTQMLFDLVVTQTLSEMLSLSLNGDFFKNDKAQWFGVGLKVLAALNESFKLAARGEFLSAKDGGFAINEKASVFEGTLTGIIPIAKNYEIRAEVRGDFASKEITTGAGTPTSPTLPVFSKGGAIKKNQFTGLIGFLAWLP